MLAVYNYLQEQKTLQNMTFSYTANAKGEVYAIISEAQETKDGNYETELVDFYLVNADTMQVTDEQKNTW